MSLAQTIYRALALFTIISMGLNATAQFDPAGGEPGSKAVHRQSGKITAWATKATAQRGWVDITDTTQGRVILGNPSDVLGAADRFVMSLGDGGSATLEFAQPLINHPEEDFAVFENGFPFMQGYFLELAFVEVSVDGVKYYRFPSVSLTDTSKQFDNHSVLDPTKLHNLAGKHQAEYGTPFELDELKDSLGDLIDSIRYIRVVDVVGNLNDSFGTRDSKGNKINDPWPTPFNSGGFDLDAVAVLGGVVGIYEQNNNLAIYPNPARTGELIRLPLEVKICKLRDMSGRVIASTSNTSSFNTVGLQTGVYVMELETENQIWQSRIVIY